VVPLPQGILAILLNPSLLGSQHPLPDSADDLLANETDSMTLFHFHAVPCSRYRSHYHRVSINSRTDTPRSATGAEPKVPWSSLIFLGAHCFGRGCFGTFQGCDSLRIRCVLALRLTVLWKFVLTSDVDAHFSLDIEQRHCKIVMEGETA
jgi:hypothetical protein